MTSKHVHWGRSPAIPPYMFASPVTSTINSTLDDLLSDTDSSAPATPPTCASYWPRTNAHPKYRPPQDPQMTFTYSYNPYRRQLRLASRLHSCLSYKRQYVPLLWDMTEEPSPQSMRALDGNALDWRRLSSPATDPQSKFMRIQCLGFNCWYPLEFGSQDKLHRPIAMSVLDALYAIYRYLQMQVTLAEYERLSAIPGLQDEVARAFYRRCARRSMARLEHSQGMRRIDCLLGNTVFLGLTLESPDPVSGYWQLRVGYSNHWASTAS